MPLIGSVADDLTGATTTGVLLARSKARTAVFFNVEAAMKAEGVDELDAIIISSNSRPLPANEAYDKVKSATIALKKMGVEYFSKRIDTTLRGGVGVEIDAMLDQMKEGTVAVVVPAMPQSRRILVGGYSVIDGVALINTPVAQDVRTPVKENYIPRLLEGQTRRKVGLVTLDKVLAGEEVIEEALAEQKKAAMQEADASEQAENNAEQSENGKEFYTIQTASDKVFYLIIDRDGDEEMVYFLTEISENDLLNTTTDNSETLPKNSAALESAIPVSDSALPNNNAETDSEETEELPEDGEESTEESTEEPEEQPAQPDNPMGTYIVLGIIAVIGIGAGYYFKVVKKKKEQFIDEDDEEDEEEVLEDEDETEDTEDDFFEKDDEEDE